jgi:hypothetical protein
MDFRMHKINTLENFLKVAQTRKELLCKIIQEKEENLFRIHTELRELHDEMSLKSNELARLKDPSCTMTQF